MLHFQLWIVSATVPKNVRVAMSGGLEAESLPGKSYGERIAIPVWPQRKWDPYSCESRRNDLHPNGSGRQSNQEDYSDLMVFAL